MGADVLRNSVLEMEAEQMARRLTLAFVTAAMLAASAVMAQQVFAIYIMCDWYTWPFCW